MKRLAQILIGIALLVGILQPQPASSQLTGGLFLAGQPTNTTITALLQLLQGQDVDGSLQIALVPAALSARPTALSEEQRGVLLEQAESQREQLQQECQRLLPSTLRCQIAIVPVFTRDEAQDPRLVEFFPNNLDAVLFLDGNPSTAMQILRGTLLEALILRRHENGALIGSFGAPSVMLSNFMLAGLAAGKNPLDALDFRAVDAGLAPAQRGLPLLPTAVIAYQPLSQGTLGCLLNAIVLPEAPGIGVGLESQSAVRLTDGDRVLERPVGEAPILILDALTYHAAETVSYHGPRATLSLHNVLLHSLAGESASYNLATRQHAFGGAPAELLRSFDALRLPAGAGPLILSGELSLDPATPVFNRFLNLSGGKGAQLALVLVGQADASRLLEAVRLLENRLSLPITFYALPPGQNLPAEFLQTASGAMLFEVGEFSRFLQTGWAVELPPVSLEPGALEALRSAWLNGLPVLAAGQAATWLSAAYLPPTPEGSPQTTTPFPGAGWLDFSLEQQLLSNPQGWNRLLSLAVARPDLLALGLDRGGAILLGPEGAQVLGSRPLTVLDLRQATFQKGEGQPGMFANGLLDVFAPGQEVVPTPAQSAAQPFRLGTPALPTDMPTPTSTPPATATPLPSPTPTRTPLLPSPTPTERLLERIPTITPTPYVIVNPLSQQDVNRMIALSVIAVLVIFFGLWLNHRQIARLPKDED